MKANLYLIALSILLLSLIYIFNEEKSHWSMIIPLGYLVYSFFVGCISLWNNRKK